MNKGKINNHTRNQKRMYRIHKQEELIEKQRYIISDLQQRIDKAIEYIYYNSTRRKIFADIIDEYKNGEPKFYGNIRDLLKILKGEE